MERPWTFEENKEFEKALAEVDPGSPAFLEFIQSKLHTKSIEQIQKRCDDFIHEVIDMIHQPTQREGRWTDDEHNLFLEGFEIYGKEWKNISKYKVKSRTPAQVASHAQKYFKRVKGSTQLKRGAIDQPSSSRNMALLQPNNNDGSKDV